MPYDGGNYQDTVARRMLKVLGENGEHWFKGQLTDNAGSYCFIGGFKMATTGCVDTWPEVTPTRLKEMAVAIRASGGECGDCLIYPNIAQWNDAPERTFDDIKLALEFYHEAELAGECVS